MMELLMDGDPLERAEWPAVEKHFPAYERFWNLHVFPLRGEDGQIRADIDRRLEVMAQENYRCFASVAEVLKQLSDPTHPEIAFSNLQNAGNRAQQVVKLFDEIRNECLNLADATDCADLRNFCSSIAPYRNLVHEGRMGMVERHGRRLVPALDKLGQYQRWSELRDAPDADLVSLDDALQKAFASLCKYLSIYYDRMLANSADVLASGRYHALFPALKPSAKTLSCRIVASSNTQLG
jgi:hypothetical protein